MSNDGIFTAVSGAIAQQQKLDTISNNLANVNTPGFKRDAQVFQEYLSSYEKQGDVIEVPRVPASIESFYNMNGGDKSYVDTKGTFTNFSQGAMKPTGNPWDLGIEGKAFFEIATPAGVRYSRNGSFTIDNQGRMITKEGFPVLAAGEAGNIEQRTIRLNRASGLQVSNEGQIFQDGASIANLSLVEFDNPQALRKEGGSFYTINPNMDAQMKASNSHKLHQGFIEGSNVNMVQEMTDMIATTRMFESLQKAIKAQDSMTDKLVNEVPRL